MKSILESQVITSLEKYMIARDKKKTSITGTNRENTTLKNFDDV